MRAASITRRGLQLLVNCSRLRKWSFPACQMITASRLHLVSKSTRLLNLSELDVTDCDQLKDATLVPIAETFPRSRDE